MTAKRLLVIGCGGVGLIVVGGVILVMVWFWHVGQDPEGVTASVEGPDAVAVGEEFTLTVVVENQRTTDSLQLSDIDIADEYIEGFLILGTEPETKSRMHIPLDNSISFSFDTTIAPRESMRFDFHLRSTTAGMFRGDVDVCEGQRFLTTLAQTLVE